MRSISCIFVGLSVRARRSLPTHLKIVGTRWVVVCKVTPSDPEVTAILVCQEFVHAKAAAKLILSDGCTSIEQRSLLLLDVTGAFLCGAMRQSVAERLPCDANAKSDEIDLPSKSLAGFGLCLRSGMNTLPRP